MQTYMYVIPIVTWFEQDYVKWRYSVLQQGKERKISKVQTLLYMYMYACTCICIFCVFISYFSFFFCLCFLLYRLFPASSPFCFSQTHSPFHSLSLYISANQTNGWRLKRQTDGNAITVYGQEPILDNSIEYKLVGLSDPVLFNTVLSIHLSQHSPNCLFSD